MFKYSHIIQTLVVFGFGTAQIPAASNLSGLYTSQAEIIIGLDETVGSSGVVDLKLNLIDSDQKLTGYLIVQAQNRKSTLSWT